MDPKSKDAEIRARVTPQTYQALSNLAAARGEQIPVIVREAIAEYLATRVRRDSDSDVFASLRDHPDIVEALTRIAEALKPKPEPGVSYAKGKTRKLS